MAAKKTAKQDQAPELSQQQINEILTILKDVGSVELKLVAPMHTHRATIAKLGLDPIEAEVRQVYFFDTPNLDLNKAGVVVRARRIQAARATPSSSCGPSTRRRSTRNCVAPRASRRRWTSCRAGSSARVRSRDAARPRRCATRSAARCRSTRCSRRSSARSTRRTPPVASRCAALATFGPTFVLKAQAVGQAAEAPARRRDVAVPRWLAQPRDLDQGRAGRGLPGRTRSSRRT